jgi:hypothetical protein
MTPPVQLQFFFPELAKYIGWEPWELHLTLEDLLTLAEAREHLIEAEHVERQADWYHRLLHSRSDPIYQECLAIASSDYERSIAEMERELACMP